MKRRAAVVSTAAARTLSQRLVCIPDKIERTVRRLTKR